MRGCRHANKVGRETMGAALLLFVTAAVTAARETTVSLVIAPT